MAPPVRTSLPNGRPVLSWRWVAGGLLHFAIATYLLLVPLLCLLLVPAHSSAETIARLVLRVSLWFLIGLAVVAVVALPAIALLDRAVRRRRARRSGDRLSPAAEQSLGRVADAVHASLDEAVAPTLARIVSGCWDHTDRRHQALSRELCEAVTAASAALRSATPERRPIVMTTTVQALTRIADELDKLAAAKAAADEAQVETLSRYLEVRYPALDSSLRPD